MKSKLALALVCLAVFALSVAAFSFFYQDVHPLGSLRLPLDADSAGRKGTTVMRDVFPEVNMPGRDAQLSRNDELIRGVLAHAGREQGMAALRETIPGYFWSLRWKRVDSTRIEVVTGDEQMAEPRESREKQLEDIKVHLSTSGDLISYEWSVHDTTAVPSSSPDTSRQVAEGFLQRYFSYINDWKYEGEKRIERARRADMEYTWHATVAPLHMPATLKMKVAGNRILAAGVTYSPPAAISTTGEDTVRGVVMVVLIIGLIVLMIIAAFKRIRAYEISFRLGVILGVAMVVMLWIELYARAPSDAGWGMLILLYLGPLFVGGAFILAWSIAESVAREAWRDKFAPLDLLVKGYVMHERVGRSLLQGLALGAAGCLVWALLVLAAGLLVPTLYVPASDDSLEIFSGSAAVFPLVTQSVTNNAFLFTAFLLFLVSLVRFRVRSPLVLVLVGALAMGVVNKYGITPGGAGIAVSTIAALVLSWGFYKFDVLTSFISLAAMSMIMLAPALFIVGNPTYMQSGYLVAACMAAAAGFGVLTMLRPERPVDMEAITPAFVKHITERERLHRELEIARDVQMSFLPRRDPSVPGMEIASRCVPALEVGGDYYDFVDLGPDRFGVVVGDVSGKGTQAAFYMTLTKGFLKAVTRSSVSPAGVLTQLNDLFYENVERGTFITMVYGIFDLRRRTVTIARAGHNPPAFRGGKEEKAEYLQSSGIALGLEAGGTFADTIQESAREISPGDLFVFYTDGLTEAMNGAKEEYGEERLRQCVEKYAAGSAPQVMQGLFADIKAFAGKARQHDDMTAVVVKVCT